MFFTIVGHRMFKTNVQIIHRWKEFTLLCMLLVSVHNSELHKIDVWWNEGLFFKLLLLLLDDISLNTGPPDTDQSWSNNEWDSFKSKRLHFIHINVNSVLLKVEELRCIACMSNAAVIGISESKWDNSISSSETEIDGYNVPRFDRNRHRGEEGCYVRNDFSFTKRNCFPHDI